jgi:hypothetical protein
MLGQKRTPAMRGNHPIEPFDRASRSSRHRREIEHCLLELAEPVYIRGFPLNLHEI